MSSRSRTASLSFSKYSRVSRQGSSEESQSSLSDCYAQLTITNPIIANWQTDGDSSMPNGWARRSSSDFLPFLAVIRNGLLPAITNGNENSNVGHHGMG